MGLTMHGPRSLNNLEKAAVDLVFWESHKPEEKRIFNELKISFVPDLGPGMRGNYANNRIKISIRKFPCTCLLYTSPSPRDRTRSRMPSSA